MSKAHAQWSSWRGHNHLDFPDEPLLPKGSEIICGFCAWRGSKRLAAQTGARSMTGPLLRASACAAAVSNAGSMATSREIVGAWSRLPACRVTADTWKCGHLRNAGRPWGTTAPDRIPTVARGSLSVPRGLGRGPSMAHETLQYAFHLRERAPTQALAEAAAAALC